MKKEIKPVEKVPEKRMSFYSLSAKDGGFQINEVIIDISNNKIVSAQVLNEPDLLIYTLNQLDKILRKSLGL